MDIERLPNSLLKGKYLHCRPIEGGPIVEAPIVQVEEGMTPVFSVAIVCPVRSPSSKCALRADSIDKHCLYWREDSRGVYQIVGPRMDQKSE